MADNEGFNVEPVYRAENIADLKTTDSLPGQFPYVRGTRNDNNWLTRQEILESEIEAANKSALDAVSKGVTALGFNIALTSAEEAASLLSGINLDKIEVNFRSCPRKANTLASALVAYLKAEGKLEQFRGSINFNPMRRQLKTRHRISRRHQSTFA